MANFPKREVERIRDEMLRQLVQAGVSFLSSRRDQQRWKATPGKLRIGDAERDEAATMLAEAHVEGRLDGAEFEQRMAAAITAVTLADLDPLFADLPERPVCLGGRGSQQQREKQLEVVRNRQIARVKTIHRVATMAIVVSLLMLLLAGVFALFLDML